jgi:drug/metabolite transporter (DMT)-like permease
VTTIESIPLSASRQRRFRADITLLAVAAIWGSAFVAQRVAAEQVGVWLFNGSRFLIAALVLAPLAWRGVLREPGIPGLRREILPGVILVGCLLVGGSAFQQAGMQYTTAGNAGFITGLYVVLIPLFEAILWSRRPRPAIWVAACMAMIGLFMLSTSGQLHLNRGDALVLISAVFWACHMIMTGRMVQRVYVLQFAIVQYLVCGLVSLALGVAFERNQLPGLVNQFWAVAYTSLISVGLGYTLQAVGQRVAPPADAAIILSLEAVFAALAGWLFLSESLSFFQVMGCAIMLAGMLLAQSDLWMGKEKMGQT